MKTSFSLLSTLFCLLLLWVVSCKKADDPIVTPTPTPTPATKSAAKAITAFAFNGLNPAVTGVIDATAKTISALLPTGTDVTKLVPTLTVSDKATVSPATGAAQDFSKAVTYTVTAEDGSTQAYTASVVVASGTTNSGIYTVTKKAGITDNADISDFSTLYGGLFSSGGKIYLLIRAKASSVLKYVYEYDIAANKWTKKSAVSLSLLNSNVDGYFTHNAKNYINIGNSGNAQNTFVEVDFTKDPASFNPLVSLSGTASLGQTSYDAGKEYYYSTNTGRWGVLDMDKLTTVNFALDKYPGNARLISGKGVTIKAVNGKLLFLGLTDKDNKTLTTPELYEFDYVVTKWTVKATPPTPTNPIRTVYVIGKKLYAQSYDSTYVYDTDTDKWTSVKTPTSYSVDSGYLNVSDGKSMYYFDLSGNFYQAAFN